MGPSRSFSSRNPWRATVLQLSIRQDDDCQLNKWLMFGQLWRGERMHNIQHVPDCLHNYRPSRICGQHFPLEWPEGCGSMSWTSSNGYLTVAIGIGMPVLLHPVPVQPTLSTTDVTSKHHRLCVLKPRASCLAFRSQNGSRETRQRNGLNEVVW